MASWRSGPAQGARARQRTGGSVTKGERSAHRGKPAGDKGFLPQWPARRALVPVIFRRSMGEWPRKPRPACDAGGAARGAHPEEPMKKKAKDELRDVRLPR